MARLARVVALHTPHHVTQRGNGRRFVLDSNADRRVYLDLLHHHSRMHQLDLLGYCLMSNHVHLIVVPARPDSLALTLKHTHGRFASYHNARHASSGHLWQGRYYSCPLDEPHLWAALRYVELNPTRAGIANYAAAYPWSSAAIHCGLSPQTPLLDLATWQQTWTTSTWAAYLAAAAPAGEIDSLRRNTHTGRPLGSEQFVTELESSLGRRLAPDKGGRPRKQPANKLQQLLAFDKAPTSHG
jgi:putative transposase